MKKKILEALKNKYKNLGLGDKAFDGVAAYIEPSVKEDTDIETAIAGVEVLLKAFQGEADKLRTEKTAAEKRLADLEAKVKAPGGAPETKEDEPDTSGQKDDKVLQALDAINRRLDGIEQGRVSETRLTKLRAAIKGAPDHFATRITDDFGRYQFKDDADFDGWIDGVKKDADELAKSVKGQGGVFTPPAGGAGGSQDVPETLKKAVEGYASKEKGKDSKPY